MLLLPHFRDGETESQHSWDLNPQGRSQSLCPYGSHCTISLARPSPPPVGKERVHLFVTGRSLVKAAQPFPAGKKCGATLPLCRSASLQL